MFNRFLNLLREQEDQDPTYIRQVKNILIFAIIATIASFVVVVTTDNSQRPEITLSALAVMLLSEIIAFGYANRGNVLLAKLFIPVSLIVASTVIAFNANSMHDTSIIGFPVIVIIANLLQGRRSIFITTPLVVLALIFLGIADMQGWTKTPIASRTGIDDILIGSVLVIAGSGILNQLIQRLRGAIDRAESNERAQLEANKELKALQESLETRVTDRTAELELANQRNEKRARQFEAIAQVARATTANENLDTLLPRLTVLISNQFGFYHTGIFLLDKERKYAVLRAANSTGGKRMLERTHKLLIGQSGIVGFVSATGNPRIALDVGTDAVFFNNPDLPDTRSELALPIRIVQDIVGVLDVQSAEANAFQEEDIEVLSTLADQVAIAIQNARSFETMQELIKRGTKGFECIFARCLAGAAIRRNEYWLSYCRE
ncbi:MAG: GAF domain-containing protein [Anaerolineales bacterium]